VFFGHVISMNYQFMFIHKMLLEKYGSFGRMEDGYSYD
jgi:hypothetical protein